MDLKLQIIEGPLKGETIEFRPESAIRIGRRIRGNTLPIKDPGISTNHLSILFESGKWVLRDLDSSNGTVLDETKIPPNTPLDLHDGSTIKIGDLTSILISFLQTPIPNGSRNTRSVVNAVTTDSTDDDAAAAANLDAPEPSKKNVGVVVEVSDAAAAAAKEKVEEQKEEEEQKKNNNIRNIYDMPGCLISSEDMIKMICDAYNVPMPVAPGGGGGTQG